MNRSEIYGTWDLKVYLEQEYQRELSDFEFSFIQTMLFSFGMDVNRVIDHMDRQERKRKEWAEKKF